ncbi:MAG: choice-of-anchor D domain-containing protein [Deltaproteobacteria bacterium]|nr:choice-of-anchor D domain-containing protein [Deltaproteobacteria bacterium]
MLKRPVASSRVLVQVFIASLALGPWACRDAGRSRTLGDAGSGVDVGPYQLGPKMEPDPAAVAFGNVQVGTEATIVVLVRNTGNATLVLDGVSRGEPFDEAFDFDIDRTSIPPSGVAQLSVSFAPAQLGQHVAQLIVRSGDIRVDDQTIEITGTGVTTTLVVDPESLSFGNVVINTIKALPITVSNTSNIDASIELVEGSNLTRCDGSDDAAFCVLLRDRNIGPDGRFSLRAGESTTMEVQFSPVIAGTRERGAFTLRACASAACEVQVRLDGVGVEGGLRCDPAVLDFGQVNPGSCLTRSVACENIANAQIAIVGWGPSSGAGQATSPDFSFEPSSVRVLNEGEAVEVDVTYCPGDLGSDVGNLQIETDQALGNRDVFIRLRGAGGGPDIEVLPSQLDFGLVSLVAPARRSVLITNLGFDDLEISDIQATGAFRAPGSGATVIPPGGAYEVVVEFHPVAVGPVESELLIRSNDQDEAELRIPLIGEGIDLPSCSFELAPAQLAFGYVQIPRTQGRAFEIRNVGSSDCLVTSAALELGTDPEFTLPAGDVRSQIIGPGAAFTILVDYSPQAVGSHHGAVELSISSSIDPFHRVPLVGTGADATLFVAPNELDFGTLGVGCATRARTVQIYNTSSTPAVISSIAQAAPTNSAFVVSQRPALPATIPPGQSVEFAVAFHADQVSRYASAVEISGTFEGNPVTYLVSLQGEGSLGASQEDRFEQLTTPKVDVLFIVDFTNSMLEEQTGLAANYQAFIQFALAQNLDYHLGVTTTGTAEEAGRLMHADRIRGNPFGGPFANRIVTAATQPDPETAFTYNLQGRPLTGGAPANEAGFYAAYQALTPPVLTGHNAGFLRPDALLSVIWVTDESEETSTDVGAPTGDLDFYVSFLRSIKGFRHTELFTASAVVGDAPSGCSGPGGAAVAGPRYIEAANRTGGVFQSICTADWSQAVSDLSTTAFGFKARFFLSNPPVTSTLTVEVDGVMVPATSAAGTVLWSYDSTTNSVNFTPSAIPEPGAELLVRYAAECL